MQSDNTGGGQFWTPEEDSERETEATQRTVSSTCSSLATHIFAEPVGVLLCSLISLEGADLEPQGGPSKGVEGNSDNCLMHDLLFQ